MLHIPVLRWGEPYQSLDVDPVVHFATGEPLAEVSRANAGLVERDLRQARRAREVLRQIPIAELLQLLKKAAELYTQAALPVGDGLQTPEEFVRLQSATTGMPEHMCRFNMTKNHYVLTHMDQILDALTRGLDLNILTRGYGVEARGVPVSYQAQSPVLGIVLPSNSPGVHTLWLPIIPLQIGLVLKPGPQEPWTPYRMAAAFFQAGVPRQAIAIYPSPAPEVGAAVLNHCPRSLIFGSSATVERYKGNPRVQVHGPGFSKIVLGEDQVDQWSKYLDLMVDSVLVNSGRGCINCSGIWVPRRGREIAAALAERLGPIEPLPPDHPQAALAAFTVPGQAEAIYADIEASLREPGVEDCTAPYGPRLVRQERCTYLRPMVLFCDSPQRSLANREYLFPFVSVVECPQDKLVEALGPTLVCTAITEDVRLQRALADAPHIDRLNIGPIPTVQLNWLQPHEGNIVDFLFRARAFQFDPRMIRL
jgi:acyl-CoA reductase-like NAD-dependent aldehyde dehydrogenase